MSLKITIHENEVLGEGAQKPVHGSAQVAYAQRFVGEGSGSGATQSTEDSLSADFECRLDRLLKKTGLQRCDTAEDTRVGALVKKLESAAESGAVAATAAGRSSATEELLDGILEAERQLTAIERSVLANTNVPVEILVDDMERTLAQLPNDRTKVRKSLELLNEKIDSTIQLSKRYRAACLQSVDSDVELVLDATTALMGFQRMNPLCSSLTADLEKLKTVELNWATLQKDLTELMEKNPQESIEAADAKIATLEEKVAQLEEEYAGERANILSQLSAFEKEFNEKFGIKTVS